MKNKGASIAFFAKIIALSIMCGEAYSVKWGEKRRHKGHWHRTRSNPGAFGGIGKAGSKLTRKYARHTAAQMLKAKRK